VFALSDPGCTVSVNENPNDLLAELRHHVDASEEITWQEKLAMKQTH
jgi:hypothetical protein